jgi:hypothetical protein
LIDTTTLAGLRDRAPIAPMVYLRLSGCIPAQSLYNPAFRSIPAGS